MGSEVDRGRVEAVDPLSRSQILAYALRAPGIGRLATSAQVEAFEDYLDDRRIPWKAWCVRRGQKLTGAFFTMLIPGRAAVVMYPEPGELGVAANDVAAAGQVGVDWLAQQALHYAQVLVEPAAAGRRLIASQLGFRLLTRLIYLERDVSAAPPAAAASVKWLPYSPDTHGLFARCILDTYENSLDCPELTDLRPIDDVIAAHKAAGQHDPALWELAIIDGRPAGALLLALLPAARVAEVVYMGVVAAFRRHGVGAALIARAAEQSRRRGATHLTLVVDERNAPARKLYQRFAFESIAERDALLHPLRAAHDRTRDAS